jgi:CheY-like chemotaxis protein
MEGEPQTKLHEKVDLREMRILAVDDSEDTREYFLYTMEMLGLDCDVAADAFQAIRMIEEAGDKPYNIFFVDWHMPCMDGIELTKKIKEINTCSSIVIMISANDWNAIEKEAVRAGVDQFIPKPLFPSTLIDAINACLIVETDGFPDDNIDAVSESGYDFSCHTILIAEDVDINREIMSAILEETGVSIEYAENGWLAVSMFSEQPGKYGLVLMDINMPEMDGYEATRQIRAFGSDEARSIPIIAMTANVFREDVEKCLAAGMNGHIGKPIDADALFLEMNKYLKG